VHSSAPCRPRRCGPRGAYGPRLTGRCTCEGRCSRMRSSIEHAQLSDSKIPRGPGWTSDCRGIQLAAKAQRATPAGRIANRCSGRVSHGSESRAGRDSERAIVAAPAQLLPWIHRLTGVDPDRVRRSLATIGDWDIPCLTALLGAPHDVDRGVRAVLLAEADELLTDRGVPMTKLLSKLRDCGQFEATWAELRCAAVILRHSDGDVRIELEAGRAQGAHADIRLLVPDGPPYASVEVKAVGLSDAELAFVRRMAPALDTVIPPHGMVTLHGDLDTPSLRWSGSQAELVRVDAGRRATAMPGYPTGLSAATIVGHGSEAQYVRRAVNRYGSPASAAARR
jgi:hypothetical protein